MEYKKHKDLVVLVSEKSGMQARDNGFSYFEHRMSMGYQNTYYVYDQNNIDLHKLSKYQTNLLLKDSFKHKKAFYKADYLLLNDGYKDVFPTIKNKPLSKGWAPILYLQHGIISYKKVFFHKGHYNGRIRYFITSLITEKNIVINSLQTQNDIKNTSLLIAKYNYPHVNSFVKREDLQSFYIFLLNKYYNNPKSVSTQDLQKLKKLILNIGFLETRVKNYGLSRHRKLDIIQKKQKNIVFFFTWREEWLINNDDNQFLSLIEKINNNSNITDYATKNDLKLSFYLHEKISFLKEMIQNKYEDKITLIGQLDFENVLRDAYMCVTDYSSVAFEFNLLKTPVIFIHFDYDQYKHERGHYLASPYNFLGMVFRTIEEFGAFLRKKDVDKMITQKNLNHYQTIVNDYENYNKTDKLIDRLISEKQKHIVYFCYNAYGVGGTVQTVINQANYLVSIGFTVTIISLRRTSDIPTLHLDPSVRLEYLNDVRNRGRYRSKIENHLAQYPSILFRRTEDLYGGLSLLIDVRLKKIIKSLSDCTIVGTFPGLCVSILKYSNKSNKILVQEHKEFSSHSPIIQKDIKKYYQKANKVLVLTEFQKTEYINENINNVINIPNGIQDKLSQFNASNPTKTNNRIVSFGRLVAMKQFNLLIDAFSLIAKDFPDWTLDIYGDGDEYNNLDKLIESYDLRKQIKIMPSTSLVYEELYNSAFCALSSSKEAFGMVYIESFSMGKPVVSFDIGFGPKEFLKNNYNSLVSDCFDVNLFAINMQKLMSNRELLNELSRNARETYLKNYEISMVMSKFLKE